MHGSDFIDHDLPLYFRLGLMDVIFSCDCHTTVFCHTEHAVSNRWFMLLHKGYCHLLHGYLFIKRVLPWKPKHKS